MKNRELIGKLLAAGDMEAEVNITHPVDNEPNDNYDVEGDGETITISVIE